MRTKHDLRMSDQTVGNNLSRVLLAAEEAAMALLDDVDKARLLTDIGGHWARIAGDFGIDTAIDEGKRSGADDTEALPSFDEWFANVKERARQFGEQRGGYLEKLRALAGELKGVVDEILTPEPPA